MFLVVNNNNHKNIGKHNNNRFTTTNTGLHGNNKKENRNWKKNQKKYSEHCKHEEHNLDSCFEIIGFPDWWKGKKKNIKRSMAHNTVSKSNHVVETSLDTDLTVLMNF